ncbi:MAG: Homoserine dehydrogenase (EC [uncultured Thiotrichaceae bacterium]|uniref:Homoserine dehydrogenase (EC) n=1 Tax=uncultured Thiotrichaceae bacterium TaxID=298394 RepID=A0A6S6SJD1_9GAMM|nr:MAG: Homoserine dehydrogenase (EC [uncultured Thiotrichaceae bacterium]
MKTTTLALSTVPDPTRIGIVGTGYISTGLNNLLLQSTEFTATKILTRRPLNSCADFPRHDILTHSIQELIDHADVIVECSGDPIHAAIIIDQAFQANIPVVTMNTEFHITCGSYFMDKGILTEAEGDQPGCLAALAEKAQEMGFIPIVYGNVKGFQDLDPSPKNMNFWAKKQGISLSMVTAATDGTKVQAEQILVANGLKAGIVQEGLLGLPSTSLEEDALYLAEIAIEQKQAISDFIIHPTEKQRIFIVATHDDSQQAALDYLKLGSGPYYTLSQNQVLCHLEILKTVKRILHTRQPLLNNSLQPTLSLAAIAKKDISAGTSIPHAIGSFEFRGIAIRVNDHPQHVPMGLLQDVTFIKNIQKGELIMFEHIDLQPSLALHAWEHTLNRRAKSSACVKSRHIL